MSAVRERAAYAWTEDSVRIVATPSESAKAAYLHVQEIGHFKTLAPYFTERENLDSYLVVYTVAGSGRLSYRGSRYELKPGQAFLIDCRTRHHYETDPDRLWEIKWVHLGGAGAGRYYEAFQAAGSPVVSLAEHSEAPELLDRLLLLQQDRTVRSELIGNRLLVGLLTELLLAAPALGAAVAEAPACVKAAIRHIETRYADKISLDRLAKLGMVSKYHLAKEFKRYTGFSPTEFLIRERVSRAKELLKYADLTVAEVAASVGIDNVSHFIRLFRDRTETTPLAFRKSWQPPR